MVLVYIILQYEDILLINVYLIPISTEEQLILGTCYACCLGVFCDMNSDITQAGVLSNDLMNLKFVDDKLLLKGFHTFIGVNFLIKVGSLCGEHRAWRSDDRTLSWSGGRAPGQG